MVTVTCRSQARRLGDFDVQLSSAFRLLLFRRRLGSGFGVGIRRSSVSVVDMGMRGQ